MPGEPDRLTEGFLEPLDLDLLLHQLGLQPLAPVEVASLFRGVQAFEKEVLDVGVRKGDPPGDLLVVPGNNQRDTRHGKADDIQSAAAEVHFVPHGWDDEREVHVVGQERVTRGGSPPVHDPVVAPPKEGDAGRVVRCALRGQRARGCKAAGRGPTSLWVDPLQEVSCPFLPSPFTSKARTISSCQFPAP